MVQEEITIHSVLKYKKDDKSGCRVSFIYSSEDKLQNADNFIGYSEISTFYKPEVFNKFNYTMINVPVIGYFEERKDFKNPLTKRLMLVKIETDEAIIDLL